MKELKKDLFECINDPDVDAICITTNGHFTKSGFAVMGGGCAKVAADRWPEVSKRLGTLLKQTGSNVPFVIGMVDENGNHIPPTADLIKNKQFKCLIFSYPTINQLIDGANLQLIKQSATIMVEYADKYDLKGIVIGRMGSGIGGLQWANVKPEVENILDDRFIVVSFEHEK
jgi:hypothetical protein